MTMPSLRTDRRGRPSRVATLAIVVISVAASISETHADIDLTGRWRMPAGTYASIAQTGSDVTVTFPSYSVEGIFDQTWFIGGPNGFTQFKQYGEGAILDGFQASGGFYHVRLTRCECFDGNQSDGDGCDAECRVEPCFTCTPEPSVCTPSADASPCDDRKDCTTGETCSAGVCANGSTVDPCVDLTGNWRLLDENISTGDRLELDTSFTQRNGVVLNATEIGNVEPTTGAMNLVAHGGSGVCNLSWWLNGTATLDNLEISGAGPRFFPVKFACDSDDHTMLFRRCDQTAGCDLADCSARADGTPCDSGSTCVVNQVCEQGACTSEPKCPLCETCTTSGNSCQAGPRLNCELSNSNRVQIVDRLDDTKDQIRWSWERSEPFDMQAFDPAGPNDLAFCVFHGNEFGYIAKLPSDTPCAEPPCWKGADAASKYRNDVGSSPFQSISLKTSESGTSKVQVKGKGAKLNSEPPPSKYPPSQLPLQTTVPTAPLPVPLTTQFQSSTGACFDAVFGSTSLTRDQDGVFKARNR
jgi:cysteine-rich repeat protein